MNEDENNQNLDNQDENQNVVPSDDNNQDLDNLDDNQDPGNQGDDNRGTDGDQGNDRQTRQERRRERLETFQAARKGYQETEAQRQQALKRDPYNPMKYDRDAEYDVNDLEKDRNQYGDSRYAQGIEHQRFYDQQERFYDKLENDSDYISSKYSFLDQESDDFDADLTQTINELYLDAAGYDRKTHAISNTNIRYKNFVTEYVKAMERYASRRNADSTKNMERQRGQAGVRPTGGTGRKSTTPRYDLDPSQMSDDELDAVINASIKKR